MLELHDPLHFEIGQVPFAKQGDLTGNATINDFVYDHALEEDDRDWPDDRVLHTHLVMLDGTRLVGNGMVVFDEGDLHCKLVAFAVHPDYRDPNLVRLFEDALARHGWIDAAFEYVRVSGGRCIPIPEIADLQHVC